MLDKLKRLKECLAEAADLSRAEAVLAWDQQAFMPPGGAVGRSFQLATLARLAHEKANSDEIGRLLDELEPKVASLPYEDDTRSLIRVTRRDYDRGRRLPAVFVAEIAQATALANAAWVKARAEKDWAQFEPHVERIMELKRREAEYVGYDEHPYDALLDAYEPGMRTSQVADLFAQLKQEVVPLVRAILSRSDQVDALFLSRHYDPERQWKLALQALELIGYNLNDGRMDKVPHPFCTTFSNHDVRVTNRVRDDFFNTCFFGALHEGGHALYEQGSPDRFERSPLAGGTSYGVHESQSRLWENQVGRSRAFWTFFFPRFRKMFRNNARDITAEKMYRAVNKVEPTFIRVEADEVTYNLHIMLRFSLETRLLTGELSVREVPAEWNRLSEELFGITPPDDAAGALQDVHWSFGYVGYFPSYSLGTIFAAQLFDAARMAMPDLEAQIERGEFSRLREWLTDNIYRHGRKFTMNELAVRITGERVQTRSYIQYIKNKYTDLYGL